MSELLQCNQLVKVYEESEQSVEVLKGLSFSIHGGEHVAILGSSGSGKSTLLHILGALDEPTSGQVLFNGQDIFALSSKAQAKFRNNALGFVYQFHHLLPEFSALENVAMPLLIAKEDKATALSKATEMLDRVGLAHRIQHRPAQLSGGERQRVAIARALVNQPQLVLADEPTGNLDESTGAAIFQLINDLKSELNTSFVIVTHDTHLAKQMDRVLTLSRGRLVEDSIKSNFEVTHA